ncbi:MerR family transcriptional regulator [Acinetobacter guerrae]|uniref:MerR family transcriptional regulator n=1 Tax=Acinetobacter guerrae TaxID=1843371 RepID=A0A3A8EQY3_9GAMM|nr:chaperone modulator CbpM [Acinetobacter guerrae]MPW45717.1 MerR family transcriptional regulator [Acinetobacter guerrae]RKG32384.1 MerR family transcriptional regulator [Acinetobacter guerrae]
MPTIHYREIVYNGSNEAEIIDEQCTFDLNHFAQVCGQSPEWILQLIEYDILSATVQSQQYHFLGKDVIRARRAYRLQRDFDASLSAVAVMLDLIDEVHQLRRQLRPNQS